MNKPFQFLRNLCLAVLVTGACPAMARTIVVDGSAVKTISAAMAMLDRNDGEPDAIDVTTPIVMEPGQVTINGKDPIVINLNAGGSPSTIVFPKTVTKAGFSIEPPFLETPCSYTIQNGVIVPQFDASLATNEKAAVYFQPVDGSIGFSAILKNLTVTASAGGDAPVPVENAFSKADTNWAHGVEFARATWNNLTDVSVNIANCTFSQLNGYGLNLCYTNANLGGLKINLTDSKMIESNPENARPMGTWATGGVVVNMTRTELADFKVMLFECMVGERGFEWNINEGCSIHDFKASPFMVWPGGNNQTIRINLNGTETKPVSMYNNSGYCFDLGSNQKWSNRRAGLSINATNARFTSNGGVLKTDWLLSGKPAPIAVKFTKCDFKENGNQPLAFQRGRFKASFSQCAFLPASEVNGIDCAVAVTNKGTGELDVNDDVIAASAPVVEPKSGNACVLSGAAALAKVADLVSRSPADNQVFQFMTRQEFTPDITKYRPQSTNAYLWIPPTCKRVRGVLVFGYNVPEHWMVGHPAIRQVCAEQDLAILFTCGSFRLCAVCHEGNYPEELKAKAHVDFLQQIMDALAKESGYDELSTAPWLPMGESMSLMIVTHVTNGAPQRCIAGIHIKDGCWSQIKSADVPMLEACGTAAEWGHHTYDLFTRWRDMAIDDLDSHIEKRAAVPAWPGSLLIEAGSAHFSVTEPMCRYFAKYIRAAVKARLFADGSPTLRPVDLNSGYVSGLATPAATPIKPKKYSECTPEERSLPWYFDQELAEAAYDMANVNWNAKSQEPVFADSTGNPIPFNKDSGITDLTYTAEKDGITFSLNSTFLDKLPVNSVKGRTPLGHVANKPAIEWVCGPVIPLGENRFQVAMDRSGLQASSAILRVIHPGDANFRLSTNPGGLKLVPNKTGKPQKITFDTIPDQTIGVREIPLHATSDAGMPVKFFVKAGPAEIRGDRLMFTPIPPRSKLPLTVTVVAWQWGRASEPAVKTASVVERAFQLTR